MSKRMKGSHGALRSALNHHAKQLTPIVDELMYGYALDLQPRGWELDHSRIGANSYSIKKGGRERHFRAVQGNTAIAVYNRYFHENMKVNTVAVLRTQMDARNFVRDTVALG